MCKRFRWALLLLLLGAMQAAAQIPPTRILCTGTDCTPIVPSTLTHFESTAAVQTAQIKGSAGILWGFWCYNLGATDTAYVKIYNQTGAPGTGDGANIVERLIVPPETFVSVGRIYVNGANFGTGLGYRVTEAFISTDATALNAGEVGCTFDWQ